MHNSVLIRITTGQRSGIAEENLFELAAYHHTHLSFVHAPAAATLCHRTRISKETHAFTVFGTGKPSSSQLSPEVRASVTGTQKKDVRRREGISGTFLLTSLLLVLCMGTRSLFA
jgi:hypothetical protein